MGIEFLRGVRAPAEQIFRSIFKHHFLNEEPPPEGPLPVGRMGSERALPPYLGEMGFEVRYNLARVEPWLSNGWKIVSRRPAFYPEGTAIAAPDFFSAVDSMLLRIGAIGSQGGIHIPPLEYGKLKVDRNFNGTSGSITIGLSELKKVATQALIEIELRELFLDWFHFDGRPISEYDRYNLSTSSTAVGNFEYHCATALRPSFLPPSFVTPPQPIPPHVGVQMRNISNGVQQPRNSDPDWMLDVANQIANHLGLEVVVYGHPSGCHIPQDAKTTWDPSYSGDHLARELGYLKSCRFMFSPDSGWADLMAWLMVPTLIDKVYCPGAYEPLRISFGGRMRELDLHKPLGVQVDELRTTEGSVLPDRCVTDPDYGRLFPWEP